MESHKHDDLNSVRLDPGMDGEVIWSFANAGSFEFACLIPGHYDSGMKGKLTVAAPVTGVTASLATEYTKGVVKKVDLKAGKVTIIHEELTGLDMPAMTMVFRTVDPAMLEKMKEGDAIEFVADRVKGKLTVTDLK
tara:strand:+ start:52 stop:459 length:408 start_codon:yes stop_codon:yes gene_type:complete